MRAAVSLPDAAGRRPRTGTIAPGAAASLALRIPAQRLVKAARSTGVKAALSRDAGRYLCNYLCWRATEAAAPPERAEGRGLRACAEGPRDAASRRAPLTFDAAACAPGEAIVLAAIAGCAHRPLTGLH